MNGLFWIFLFFSIGCVAFVSIQTVIIVFLEKWNKELRAEVKALQTPF
jgi:hypothetical protein